MLPPFLTALPSDPKHFGVAVENAIFKHKAPLGNAHAQWWSPKDASGPPDIVLLFVPGNPGLIEFYTPFLCALHAKYAGTRLAILAHGHIDHTPDVVQDGTPSAHSLTAQIQNAVEAFDAINVTYGGTARIILIGHSVGAWICLQVLKERANCVSGAFLLFPTISHIKDTPNGRKLSQLFTPVPRYLVSNLGYLARLVPDSLVSFLLPEWPLPQISVIVDLIRSPLSIGSALSMANDEMDTIKDLDLATLQLLKHKLWFYYAEKDDWIGSEREYVLNALHPDDRSVRVVHDQHGIPHAFCINHGEQLAQQCSDWLVQLSESAI